MSVKQLFQSTQSPWTHLLVVAQAEKQDRVFTAPAGFVLTVIRGAKCKTKAGLFAEFVRGFSFPDYFGENWDAFEECLTDLDWLPAKGYFTILTDADQVLSREEDCEEYQTLIEILNEAGESWASRERPGAAQDGVPFHTVLVVSDRQKLKRKNWLVSPLPREGKATSSTQPSTSSTRKSHKRR